MATDPVVIGECVELWRQRLEAALRHHRVEALDWDERADGDYFTDRPGWVGCCGLWLLAAHTVSPEYRRPERVTLCDEDAAYQSLAKQQFRCRFSQLFNVTIWLPPTFAFTFQAEDGAGKQAWFGSSVTLLDQLRLLNDGTYKATAETLDVWRSESAGSHDTFDQAARFGLAMFLHHAQLSMEHRLPMILDY